VKFSGSTHEIDYYRVQQRWTHIEAGDTTPASRRVPERWWKRTWQAEWEDCDWAPRAYTRWGIERRATRWHGNGGRHAWQIAAHRWIRRNVTDRAHYRDRPSPTDLTP
jgi:hypothetical protein